MGRVTFQLRYEIARQSFFLLFALNRVPYSTPWTVIEIGNCERIRIAVVHNVCNRVLVPLLFFKKNPTCKGTVCALWF